MTRSMSERLLISNTCRLHRRHMSPSKISESRPLWGHGLWIFGKTAMLIGLLPRHMKQAASWATSQGERAQHRADVSARTGSGHHVLLSRDDSERSLGGQSNAKRQRSRAGGVWVPGSALVGPGMTQCETSAAALEVLDGALVLFGGVAVPEGAQVAALACPWVLLQRIEAVLAGFEFADHGRDSTARAR